MLAARSSRVEEISIALQAILDHAAETYRVLLAEPHTRELVRPAGELYVYERREVFERATPWHDLRRKRRVEVVDLEPAELRQLEPALAPIFHKGVFLPDSVLAINPYIVTRTLADAFAQGGGEIIQEDAREILANDARPTLLLTDRARRKIDQLVIATGAFSKRWARQLACDSVRSISPSATAISA